MKKQLDIMAGALATAVIVGLVTLGTLWSIEHQDEDSTPAATQQNQFSTALTQAGRELFTGSAACSACHTIDGISQGVVGPPLNHIGSEAANRIPGYTAATYIRLSIIEPDAHKAGTAVGLEYSYPPRLTASLLAASTKLSETEVQALVAFLMQQK